MTKNEIRTCLAVDFTDLEFVYKGKKCGVTSEVHNYIPTYDIWYGDDLRTSHDVDKLMSIPLFDGKTLGDIASYVS